MTAQGAEWTGGWVEERLGVVLHTTSAPYGLTLHDLVGLALRKNPKRAHLLVSSVLGKHVPASPEVIERTGHQLGTAVEDLALEKAVAGVIGFAETATSLGQLVAEQLGAYYVHSTRRSSETWPLYGAFSEAHSHAVSHMLFLDEPEHLHGDGPVVLVDDELSTGRTAIDLIRSLDAVAHHEHYVVAALIDLRNPDDHARFRELEHEMDTRIDVVSLATGRIDLPDDMLERSAEVVAFLDTTASHEVETTEWKALNFAWPDDLPTSGRHGVLPPDLALLDSVTQEAAVAWATQMNCAESERVLVLGTEELMFVPLRMAAALERELGGRVSVEFGSTTRSPVLVVDASDYPIRTAATFIDPEGTDGARFVYNTDVDYDHVVLITDEEATAEWDSPAGLLQYVGRTASSRWHYVLPSSRTAKRV